MTGARGCDPYAVAAIVSGQAAPMRGRSAAFNGLQDASEPSIVQLEKMRSPSHMHNAGSRTAAT